MFEAINGLNERERYIMECRFGLNGKEEMTQKEVADHLGISQSYISRLEKKIILELREYLEPTNLIIQLVEIGRLSRCIFFSFSDKLKKQSRDKKVWRKRRWCVQK